MFQLYQRMSSFQQHEKIISYYCNDAEIPFWEWSHITLASVINTLLWQRTWKICIKINTKLQQCRAGSWPKWWQYLCRWSPKSWRRSSRNLLIRGASFAICHIYSDLFWISLWTFLGFSVKFLDFKWSQLRWVPRMMSVYCFGFLGDLFWISRWSFLDFKWSKLRWVPSKVSVRRNRSNPMTGTAQAVKVVWPLCWLFYIFSVFIFLS